MSSRARAERGFSLLEMTVAMIVLSITVLGLSRLLAVHERLLDSVDSWCRDEPSLYVVQPTAPFERECGVAATLSVTEPDDASPGSSSGAVNDVVVESVSRALSPATASATVKVTPK